MACRLLNSSADPHRMIRRLRLPWELQSCVQTGVERIDCAESILDLSHAHGRAIGLGTGLVMVNAITIVQFRLLGKAYMQAFEDRLAFLAAQPSLLK